MIARQSLAVAIVPKGHPINSRRHTRVFQRRVRSAFISSPEGTAEILEFRASLELGDWDLDGPSLFLLPSWVPSKANQTYPNLSQPIPSIFRNKRLFIFTMHSRWRFGDWKFSGAWMLGFGFFTHPVRTPLVSYGLPRRSLGEGGSSPSFASLCNLTQGYARLCKPPPPGGYPTTLKFPFVPMSQQVKVCFADE